MTMAILMWIEMGCWIVCFWWMHRLSDRQESLLKELHEMTGRIERLSEAEHKLIKEVHPTVSDIKERVENVQDAVASESAPGKK